MCAHAGPSPCEQGPWSQDLAPEGPSLDTCCPGPRGCVSHRCVPLPGHKQGPPTKTFLLVTRWKQPLTPGSQGAQVSDSLQAVFGGGALQCHGTETPREVPPQLPSAAQAGPSCGLGRRGRAGVGQWARQGVRGSSPALETDPTARKPRPCPTPGAWSMPGSGTLSLWAITSSEAGTQRSRERKNPALPDGVVMGGRGGCTGGGPSSQFSPRAYRQRAAPQPLHSPPCPPRPAHGPRAVWAAATPCPLLGPDSCAVA